VDQSAGDERPRPARSTSERVRTANFRPSLPWHLAEQFRQELLARHAQDGELIWSVEDIVVRSGAARASVREALRILESEGFVDVRPGRNGGVYARVPTIDVVTRSIENLLWYEDVHLGDVFMVRNMVESFAVTQLMEPGSDLARLEATIAPSGDGSMLETCLNFHRDLVRAADNTFLLLVHDVCSSLIRTSVLRVGLDSEAQALVNAAHQGIANALQSRDGATALRRLQKHLDAYRDYYESAVGARLNQVSLSTPSPRGS
jgi:GntR family transcriptional repressor for pyruvate dehydrogenase complex